ncbi:MAG TPA: MnhB domain-containing protein [Jatrophihabitans sp.]|jgi:multicomponent Na+:H+ antiporter subunit B|nr:MnhB domain-containing protein [Jatrophihabitans sp.]
MNRTVRIWLFAIGALAIGTCLVIAFVGMPSFGSTFHPYRDMAIRAAVHHATANAVGSVNFDQRSLDTLGEEIILLASVVGVAALLRPAGDERESGPSPHARVLEPTRLLGYVMLPLVLVIGADVVTHGHVTPGGGFQGGVVVASGVHLLYVAGSYRALERLRPIPLFEAGEALGAAAFACIGIVGVVSASAFLLNTIGQGSFGGLFSAGTIPLLNGAVGLEVASGIIVLIAKFLDQAILLGGRGP